MYKINRNRYRLLKEVKTSNKNILYCITRDLRIQDNWSFIFSQLLTNKLNSEMYILYNVEKNSFNGIRHFNFLVDTFINLEKEFKKYNSSFYLLTGDIISNIKKLIRKCHIGYLVIDQNPLVDQKKFYDLNINLYQVDSHNIIPVWISSNKQEYNAYTLRLKINKLLEEYLDDFPILKPNKNKPSNFNNNNINKIKLMFNNNTPELKDDFFKGTYKNGMKRLFEFKESDTSSFLSPWLHFGIISAQRCVLEKKNNLHFIEQILIRKELSDNFCYYNKNYKSITSCYEWAQKTLNDHLIDKRDKIYTIKELEEYKTNDLIWNKCQKYICDYGYLNNYYRMYWAKKILEWSYTPQEAIDKTIYLNDKFFLDGQDPISYTNILWCIGGLHDRAFKERKIYGKIRYISNKKIKI